MREKEQYPYLIKIAKVPKKLVLTDALMETLSVIAYKQPITRLEVERIRGVNSDHAVNRLVELDLVAEVGRLDAPGRPLLFGTTEQFLRRKGISWARYQIAECYMIMGGIPYYLNLLSNRLSYPQNIDRLFFQHHGLLWDEFEHLYRTLFSNSEIHIRVAQALSGKTGGMTRSELSAKTGISDNGNLTRILNNLIASDFVRVSRFYGKKIKDAKYQLSDYYTAFYFRFLRDRWSGIFRTSTFPLPNS